MLQVYFTPMAYNIYHQGNQCNHMGFSGIGLGLICAQRFFWTSTVTLGLAIYYKGIFLGFVGISLYLLTFYKTTHLLQILEEIKKREVLNK